MGQYIQAGICHRIKIRNTDIERYNVSFEQVKEALSKTISLDLYEINEVENGYIFELKDSILENGELVNFLSEQYELLCLDAEHNSRKIIDDLKALSSAADIIALANKKMYQHFQASRVYDNIYCTIWRHNVMVEYEMMIFMLEGKVMMECYSRFLKYVEGLIKKNSSYQLNGAIKVIIG